MLTSQSVSLKAIGIFEDGTSQNLTGVVSWSAGPVFSSPTPGVFNFTATRDAIVGSATVNVSARTPGDDVPPLAEITSPATNTTVTEPVDIIGTASDGNFLKYELAYALAGDADFTPIVTSTTPVTGGVLGQFDPTLLINDLYTIRLTVFDAGGNQTVDEVTVQVSGELKIGNFSLTFKDLGLPVSGIPVTVSRTYDSRDKGKGDFGVGWRLGIDGLRIRANRILGTAWQVDKYSLSFSLQPTDFHLVSLRLPGGRIEAFDMLVTPAVSPLVPFPPSRLNVQFVPRPGTRGSLALVNQTPLTVLGAQPGVVELVTDDALSVFDPDRFKYTSKDGDKFTISAKNGVEIIEEQNGNTITFSDSGIIHSSGESVLFERDDSGRITAIDDPLGNRLRYRYDANGDLTLHTDRNGNSTTFKYDRHHGLIEMTGGEGVSLVRNEYDSDGRIIKSTDADGKEINYIHDIDGKQETIFDRNGAPTTLNYDEAGNIIRKIDALGNVKSYEYDSAGNQTRITDPAGNVWQSEYDAFGNQTRFADPMGGIRSAEYNSRNLPTRLTDPTGATTLFEYDVRGNLIRETDPLGNSQESVYDSKGNLTQSSDALGNVTTLEYDASGFLISKTDPSGAIQHYQVNGLGDVVETRQTLTNDSGESVAVWQLAYDANQNQISEKLPGQDTPSTMSFDGNDQLVGSTNSQGTSWDATRNALGQVASQSSAGAVTLAAAYDAEGRVTAVGADDFSNITFEYDAIGNKIQLQSPETGTFSKQWNSRSLLEEEADEASNIRRHAYDLAGRRTKTVRPDTGERNIEYDIEGKIIRQTDSSGYNVQYVYDELDRVTELTGPDGITRQTQYDDAGRVTHTQGSFGEQWSYAHDSRGLLVETQSVSGADFNFEYDSFGFIKRTWLPNGSVLRYQHDALGRMVSHTLPQGQQRRLTYDEIGRIIESEKFDGTIISLAYDDLAKTMVRSADGLTQTFGYDARGRITSMLSDDENVQISFDGVGKITRWQDTDGRDTQYGYDISGRTNSISTPNGETTSTYDIATRVSSTTYVGQTSTFARNQLGIPVSISLPGNFLAAHTYDGAGRALSLSYSLQSSLLEQLDYAFDDEGRISEIQRLGSLITSYEYDLAGRLTNETKRSNGVVVRSIDYGYDLNGNLSTRTTDGLDEQFAYDANDRLISDGATQYGWDANGNLVTADRGSVRDTYTYDSQDRLMSVERTGDEAFVVEYKYHQDGLLRSRRQNGEETMFVWDRSNPAMPMLLEETNANGELIRRYFNDGMFVTHSIDSNGESSYFMRDHAGSVIGVVTGGITTRIQYDAYGRVIEGASALARIGFVNAITDEATGFIFMRSRWYDPVSTRFLTMDSATPDPLRPVSFNRYAYTAGDPVNRFDPGGQSEFTIANVLVSLSVASALFSIGHIAYLNGPEEIVAGGFGVKRILFRDAGDVTARFVRWFGSVSADLNAWGIGFTGGFERLKFDNKVNHQRANYWYFGPSLSIPSSLSDTALVGGGVTGTIYGLGSAIFHTPLPEHYQGYFVSAAAGGSVAGNIAKNVAQAGLTVSGSVFWSPVPTYWLSDTGAAVTDRDDCHLCESRYSFGWRGGVGLTAGRGEGGTSKAFSISITWYTLAPGSPFDE